MTDTTPCTLLKHLTIASGNAADYEQLARFHYRSALADPIRHIYKLVDLHPWRFLTAGVGGVVVYAAPAPYNPKRTEFILSQLAETPANYLWENPHSPANF